MGAAAVQKPATSEAPVRRDPVRRPADGAYNKFRVMNPDPRRHYCAVYKLSDDIGIGYFESLGYDIERKRPGGPTFQAGNTVKEGEPVECQGHVLMSCSKEQRLEHELYGEDGVSGQTELDRRDAKMLKKGGVDHGRGLNAGNYMAFENDTKILEAPKEG